MAQFNIQDYDRYIVSFSGGKKFTAPFFYLFYTAKFGKILRWVLLEAMTHIYL